MAEAVQALLLQDYEAQSDALIRQVQQAANEQEAQRAFSEHSSGSQRSLPPRKYGQKAADGALQGTSTGDGNVLAFAVEQAGPPSHLAGSGPIMRRASWVEGPLIAAPSMLAYASAGASAGVGFGLPRTPLRVMSFNLMAAAAADAGQLGEEHQEHPPLVQEPLLPLQQQQQQDEEDGVGDDAAGGRASEAEAHGRLLAASAVASGRVLLSTISSKRGMWNLAPGAWPHAAGTRPRLHSGGGTGGVSQQVKLRWSDANATPLETVNTVLVMAGCSEDGNFVQQEQQHQQHQQQHTRRGVASRQQRFSRSGDGVAPAAATVALAGAASLLRPPLTAAGATSDDGALGGSSSRPTGPHLRPRSAGLTHTPSAAAAAVARVLWPADFAGGSAAAANSLGAGRRGSSPGAYSYGMHGPHGPQAQGQGAVFLPGEVSLGGGGSGEQEAVEAPGMEAAAMAANAGAGAGAGGRFLLPSGAKGAGAKEVDWWLMAAQESRNSNLGGGDAGGGGLRHRRHKQWHGGTAGDDHEEDGELERRGGSSGRTASAGAAAMWWSQLRTRMQQRSGPGEAPGGGGVLGERVPWYHLALDLFSLVDRTLPLFLPSRSRTCWDFFMLLLLMYTAAMVPLEAGFRAVRALAALQGVSWAVLVAFWADIAIQFRSAYISDTGDLVRNSRRVASHYAATWLPLDLASSLPWSELLAVTVAGGSSSAGALITLLRVTRLLKLVRLLRVLDRLRYAVVLRLSRLFALMLLVAHWTACLWHGMSEWLHDWPWIFDRLRQSGASGFLSDYSYALYHSFVLVVGSDNLPAANNVERVFYVVMLIVGAVLYALIISNIAVLATNMNSLSSRYRLKAALAADALRYMGAPSEQRDRVAEYYDFLATNDHPGPEADAFLSELPVGLVEDIKWSLYAVDFHALALFAGCDEPFMAALQSRLTLVAFTPGEVIFKEGDAGQHMFLVRQGNVLLRSTGGDVVAVVRTGEAFGELALLPELAARRRRVTAVAGRPTDLVALAGRDLAAACKDHPDSGTLVQERLMQQLEDVVHGTQWTWFIEKVLVPYQLHGDVHERQGPRGHGHGQGQGQGRWHTNSAWHASGDSGTTRSHNSQGGGYRNTGGSVGGSATPRHVEKPAAADGVTSNAEVAGDGSGAGGGAGNNSAASADVDADACNMRSPSTASDAPATAAAVAAEVDALAASLLPPSPPIRVLSRARLEASWSGKEGPLVLSATPDPATADMHQSQAAVSRLGGAAAAATAAAATPSGRSSRTPTTEQLLLDIANLGTGASSVTDGHYGTKGKDGSTRQRMSTELARPSAAAVEAGSSLVAILPLSRQASVRRALERSASRGAGGDGGGNVGGGSRRLARNLSKLLESLSDMLPPSSDTTAQPTLQRMRTNSRRRSGEANGLVSAGLPAAAAEEDGEGGGSEAGAGPAVTAAGGRRMSAQAATNYLRSVTVDDPDSAATATTAASTAVAAHAPTGSTSRQAPRRGASRVGWSAFAGGSTGGQQHGIDDGRNDTLGPSISALLLPHLETANYDARAKGGVPSLVVRRSRSRSRIFSGNGGAGGSGATGGGGGTKGVAAPASQPWLPGHPSREGQAGSPPLLCHGSGGAPHSPERVAAGGGTLPLQHSGHEGSLPQRRSLEMPSSRRGSYDGPASRQGSATGLQRPAGLWSRPGSDQVRHAAAAMAAGAAAAAAAAAAADPRAQLQAALVLLAGALGLSEAAAAAQAPPALCPSAFALASALYSSSAPAAADSSAPLLAQLLCQPSSRQLLVALADAVVRREGATGVPAVAALVAAGRREAQACAEAAVGRVLHSVVDGMERVEKTVSSLDESLHAASRRLAALEQEALQAQSEGVLTLGPLGLVRAAGRGGRHDSGGDDEGGDGRDGDSDDDDDGNWLVGGCVGLPGSLSAAIGAFSALGSGSGGGDGGGTPGSTSTSRRTTYHGAAGGGGGGVGGFQPVRSSGRPLNRTESGEMLAMSSMQDTAGNGGGEGEGSTVLRESGSRGWVRASSIRSPARQRLSRMATGAGVAAAPGPSAAISRGISGATSRASSRAPSRRPTVLDGEEEEEEEEEEEGDDGDGGGGGRGGRVRHTTPSIAQLAQALSGVAAAAEGGRSDGGDGGSGCGLGFGRSRNRIASALGMGDPTAAMLAQAPYGSYSARRRSLDAAEFSMLQVEWQHQVMPDLGNLTSGGEELTLAAAPRERRRSRSAATVTLQDGALVADAAADGSGAASDGGAGAPAAFAPEHPQGPRSRRASMLMLQAGMLTPEEVAGMPPGSPHAVPLSSPHLIRRMSYVLDDSVVSGGGGGGGGNGVAPSERPGARRTTAAVGGSGGGAGGSGSGAGGGGGRSRTDDVLSPSTSASTMVAGSSSIGGGGGSNSHRRASLTMLPPYGSGLGPALAVQWPSSLNTPGYGFDFSKPPASPGRLASRRVSRADDEGNGFTNARGKTSSRRSSLALGGGAGGGGADRRDTSGGEETEGVMDEEQHLEG